MTLNVGVCCEKRERFVMKSFLTILKVFATVAVVLILVFVVLAMQKVREEFGKPEQNSSRNLSDVLEQNQITDFEPGQREFNRALELIALGELEEAREKLLFVQNLFPNSMNGVEVRRILGEMNLDELLSVQHMDNKKIHVVRSGDAYLNIANRHDTTIDCIMYLNDMMELGVIHPGDELVVMGLHFTVLIDVPHKRIQLFRQDDEKKQNVFVKEYLVQSMSLPALRGDKISTKISLKRGERKGMVYSPTTHGYRSAEKVLMLARPSLQIRQVPAADSEDPGRGFFLKESDMEELALLMRIGNEVEIKL